VHPRISLNLFTTNQWLLADDLALCRELGIRHVGFISTKYDPEDPGVAAEQCAEAGVDAALVATWLADVSPLELGPEAGGAALLEHLRSSIDTAAVLKAPLVYFPSGVTPPRTPTDRAIEALVAALAPAVAYAAERGVRLGVENNSVSTRHHGFAHTMADTVRIADEANIDICMEIQNCWIEGGLEPLLKANIGRIGVVQVSDFSVGEDIRMNRRVPGDGDVPLEWLIGALLDCGYQGLFDIELVGPHIQREGVASAVRRSAEWLADMLTRSGA
jgi:sugar phosphate isomerase/epimerase